MFCNVLAGAVLTLTLAFAGDVMGAEASDVLVPYAGDPKDVFARGIFPAGTPAYIERHIQRKIGPEDKLYQRLVYGKTAKILFTDVMSVVPGFDQYVPVRPDYVGKWMTLSCYPKSQLVAYSIRNEKL
jgi:hypothetical protein